MKFPSFSAYVVKSFNHKRELSFINVVCGFTEVVFLLFSFIFKNVLCHIDWYRFGTFSYPRSKSHLVMVYWSFGILLTLTCYCFTEFYIRDISLWFSFLVISLALVSWYCYLIEWILEVLFYFLEVFKKKLVLIILILGRIHTWSTLVLGFSWLTHYWFTGFDNFFIPRSLLIFSWLLNLLASQGPFVIFYFWIISVISSFSFLIYLLGHLLSLSVFNLD